MLFKAEVPVPSEAIMYAFVGTIETGYDWFHRFAPVGDHPGWYSDKEFFERDDFKIEVIYDDPEGGEDRTVKKIIGPDDIQEGLRLMALNAPDDLANLLSDVNHDVNTYDVFMQYVVLGEVFYG